MSVAKKRNQKKKNNMAKAQDINVQQENKPEDNISEGIANFEHDENGINDEIDEIHEAHETNQTHEIPSDLLQKQYEVKITALEEELESTKDKMMRIAAEAENIKRRAEKEKQDASRYAISNFAQDLLQVADNLERAVLSIPEEARNEEGHLKSIIEGVTMTNNLLQNCFKKQKIEKVPSIGTKFSHDLHQVISEIDDENHEAGEIVQVLQEGYQIHERLLRAAMVITAKG